jgi:hypothetical protein
MQKAHVSWRKMNSQAGNNNDVDFYQLDGTKSSKSSK